MNLIILPGNSIKNLEWSKKVEKALSPHFNEIKILHYRHWSSGEETINLEYELSVLSNLTKGDTSYVIFAKSAGALLALRAVYEGSIRPLRCIFIGIAVLWGEEYNLPVDSWLRNYSLPTLFIQKEFDPAIHFKDLDRLLKELNVKNYKLQKVMGEDHEYDDINLLKDMTLKFI